MEQKKEQNLAIEEVEDSLRKVMDPEIPVLSVMDLGMITGIQVCSDHIEVRMIPTFSACPAVQVIRGNIKKELEQKFSIPVRVDIDHEISWNSNRITAEGKEKLRQFKIAPPAQTSMDWDDQILSEVPCPFCQSRKTYLRSPFGSTLCRSLHFCKDCGSLFEHFKELE